MEQYRYTLFFISITFLEIGCGVFLRSLKKWGVVKNFLLVFWASNRPSFHLAQTKVQYFLGSPSDACQKVEKIG